MRIAQVAQVAFIIAAAVGVYSFVRAAQTDQRLSNCQALCQFRPTYAGTNRRAPDFELPNMKGEMVRFSSLRNGKPVILNFWTRTCPPCMKEMPTIQEMAGILAKDGIKVVTVCTDDGPEAIQDDLAVALNNQAPFFEILFDPETTVVTDMYGSTLYPETWIIDGHGIIRARVDGPKRWSSAMSLEVVEMVSRPFGCPVEFAAGRLTKNADLCDCAPANGSCMSDAECCDPTLECVKGYCKAPPPRAAPRAPASGQLPPGHP